jgi:hypothetical protein
MIRAEGEGGRPNRVAAAVPAIAVRHGRSADNVLRSARGAVADRGAVRSHPAWCWSHRSPLPVLVAGVSVVVIFCLWRFCYYAITRIAFRGRAGIPGFAHLIGTKAPPVEKNLPGFWWV